MDTAAHRVQHAFSIDLEDWYQGVELELQDWGGKENRLAIGTERVLDLLAKAGTTGTFFVLGWVAEQFPQLIKLISDRGHEIASHGYSHRKVYSLSKQEFREEIRRTKSTLEHITGRKVLGHRSPFFSITSESLWALEILKQEGFSYDCSISPVRTWRYGIASCPEEIFAIDELDLIEYPVSTFKILSKRFGVGGAYFRIFPYALTRRRFVQGDVRGTPTMFYAHPWEFDPLHPRLGEMELKAKLTHYANLRFMGRRTADLLRDFSFTTVAGVIQKAQDDQRIERISINTLS